MTSQRKKKPFLVIRNRIFPKGLTYAFRQKMPFSLYLDLVNIRLEIMVNDFEETKETFLTIKNRIFQSLKNRTFPKGLTLAFGPKLQIFFVYVDLEKIRLKIMLTDFHRKKKPF